MNKLFIKGISLCVLILISLNVLGNPFVRFSVYTNQNSHINNYIQDIIQDQIGLIWFSTYDGLYRYDSNTFKCYKATFNNRSPLVSNHIDLICENSQHDIWCLASGEVYLFNRLMSQFYEIDRIKNHFLIRNWNICAIYNHAGKTFFSSDKGGLFYVIDKDNECTPHILQVEKERQYYKSMVNDALGNLWVFYNNQTLVLDSIMKKILPYEFDKVLEVGEEYWLINKKGVMAYSDLQSLQMVFLPDLFDIKRISSSLYDNRNFVFLSTDKGLVVVDVRSKQQRMINVNNCIRGGVELKKLFLDSKNQLLVSTNSSVILKVNTVTFEVEVVNVPENFSEVELFLEDRNHVIWICSHEFKSLLYYSVEKNSFVTSRDNLIKAYIRCYMQDRDGNLWLGTNEGLESITFTEQELLIKEMGKEFIHFFKRSNGDIWCTTRDGYIHVCDSNLNRIGYLNREGKILVEKSCWNSTICDIEEDSRGNIWMAARKDGLFLLSPKDKTDFYVSQYRTDVNDPYSISCSNIYTLYKDSYNHIWVGGLEGGINLIRRRDDGNYIFINSNNELSHNRLSEPASIRCFLQKDSVMFVGSEKGLYTFNCCFDNPREVTFWHNKRNYRVPHSLSNNAVLCALETSDGKIYLGTSGGGVCVVESKKLLSDNIRFRNLNREQNRLPSDIVQNLIEDGRHRIWGFCDNNCFYLNNHDSSVFKITNYKTKNALQFSIGNSIIVHDNLLLKGGVNNLFIVKLDCVMPRKDIPSIYISDIVSLSENKNLYSEQYDCVNINPEDRNISITFSALDYQKSVPIEYAYRVIGVDRSWNYSILNTVNYMNLPPGKHIFEVRSTNGDGIWIDNTKRIMINVIPTFWETSYAWLVYIFAGIVLMFTAFYIQRRFYLLRDRLKLERRLNEAKLNFFTDISHEIRTPLTLIDAPIGEVLNDSQLSSKSREYLLIVRKNTQYLLNLISQLLDFRKLEDEHRALLIEPLEINYELNEIMLHFRNLAEEKNIRFQLYSDMDECILWVDKEYFGQIFFNLISNAFKYTPSGKTISILLQKSENGIEISVVDEGGGIDEKNIHQLFQKYATFHKKIISFPSTGLGLFNVKSLADDFQARIAVSSTLHEGTRFVITFKEGFEHYQDKPNVKIISLEEHLEASSDDLPSVLIVEDNYQLRKFIVHILSSQYRVFEASNGEEGIRSVRDNWPDLIISDIMMPVMSGLDMVKKLREDADVYLIPIILLTAKSSVEDKIRGAELFIDDYITKPFSAAYLKTKINALIENRKYIKQQILDEAQKSKSQFKVPVSLSQVKINGKDEKFIQEVMKLLDENFKDSDFNINKLASYFCMSRPLFNNKIKTILGCTPIELLMRLRIEYSITLLDNKDMNISEIAYQAGFNDPKYFSRLFKKTTGKTPSEFQKNEM